MSAPDPYKLLHRAQAIIEASYPKAEGNPRDLWLKDYDKLPGAELSGGDLKVLADPHRRLREGKAVEQSIKKLLKGKYLRKVRNVHGPNRISTQIRRTAKGLAALRLRGKV